MAQFIGSIISLVSKSDIRYIGKLEAINPEEATVSLSEVRSQGTEGRRGGDPAVEIPPSDAKYDYIVFRAADVKDLKIEQNAPVVSQPPTMPEDPAIMSAGQAPKAVQKPVQPPAQKEAPAEAPKQQQPQQNQAQQYQQQQPPFAPNGGPGPHSPWGMPPPPPHGFPPYGYGMPPPPMQPGYQGPFAAQAAHQPWGPPPPQMMGSPFNQPPSMLPQQPPQFGSNQQIPAQQVTQRPEQQKQTEKAAPIQTTTNTLPDAAKPKEQPTSATSSAAAQAPPKGRKAEVLNTRAPSAPAATGVAAQPPSAPAAPQAAAVPQKPASFASAVSQRTAANGQAPATAGPALQEAKKTKADGVQSSTAAVARLASQMDSLGFDRNQSRSADNRGGMRGGAPRGASRGGINHGYGAARPLQQQQQSAPVPTNDFDFAASNEKFQKEKVEDEDQPTEGAVIIPEASPSSFYNKSSFFDNISSDLKSNQADGRFDRRAESNKNMATFGETGASANGRGRGRGGRGRGNRGGPFRGGNSPNYRGRGRAPEPSQ